MPVIDAVLFSDGIPVTVAFFDRWNRTENYYKEDPVVDDDVVFKALADNQGMKPAVSSSVWRQFRIAHPYFFLRDSAAVHELGALLKDEDPAVRVHAFAALHYRGASDLFGILESNLSDDSKLTLFIGDFGEEVCPADIMIMCLIKDLNADQLITLRKKVENESHLVRARELLRGR